MPLQEGLQQQKQEGLQQQMNAQMNAQGLQQQMNAQGLQSHMNAQGSPGTLVPLLFGCLRLSCLIACAPALLLHPSACTLALFFACTRAHGGARHKITTKFGRLFQFSIFFATCGVACRPKADLRRVRGPATSAAACDKSVAGCRFGWSPCISALFFDWVQKNAVLLFFAALLFRCMHPPTHTSISQTHTHTHTRKVTRKYARMYIRAIA